MAKLSKTKKYWWLMVTEKVTKIVHDTYDAVHDRTVYRWTSLSGWHETKKSLIAGQEILPKPCKECGGIVSTCYQEELRAQLRHRNICFYCYFWLEKLDVKDYPTTVRVSGTHYMISPDNSSTLGFKGFGGAEFRIKFNDGRYIVSHNLWCQGDIPERFKDRLPDNAVFVERE